MKAKADLWLEPPTLQDSMEGLTHGALEAVLLSAFSEVLSSLE